jgi:hypothetical protein
MIYYRSYNISPLKKLEKSSYEHIKIPIKDNN